MDIERVKKNLSVSVGKGSYKAVGEGAVLAAVKPIEIALGIYSYPYNRTITETAVLVNSKTYNGETNERKELFLRIETVYRFVNVDDPKDYVDVTTYGDGIDGGDKAPGKAMTYADKYALLKAYKIETGDDPDQEGSKEYKEVQKHNYAKDTKVEFDPSEDKPISPTQSLLITQMSTPERIAKVLEFYKVSELKDLNELQASIVLKKFIEEKTKK